MRVYNLTPAQFGLSNIALKRLKVARYEDLNDPFELLAVDVAAEELRTIVKEKKSQVNEKEGLLSFSKSWKHPLLWSHYADKHRGIGLGFDIPDELLTPVSYNKGMRRVNIEKKHTKQETIDRFLHRLRYTKFKDWQYEDEVRMFFDLDKLEEQTGLHFCSFSDDLSLREVILGPRCDIPIKAIRELVKNFDAEVQVIKARIAYDEFSITEDHSYRETKQKRNTK